MWIMGRNACDPFSNNDRSAQISKKPTKSICRANGDQRQGKNQAGKAEIVGQKPDMTTVKSRDDNNKDVSDSDYASLGWGKPAGENAAQQDDWDHQGERCIFESSCQIAKCSAWPPHASGSKEIAIDHQADANHHAGYKTRHKKSGDRDIPDCAINH